MTHSADTSFFRLTELYPDEPAAVRYFEEHRWPGGSVVCPDPKCESTNVLRGQTKRKRQVWYCHGCGDQFSVTTGTIMQDTKLPLRKWLFAFHFMGASKKGISALQLSRMLEVTYKTAWHLCHRIRATMTENSQFFTGIVETDETYIGGKRTGMGRGYRGNKMAVQTIVERSTPDHLGQVQSIVLNDGNKVDGRSVGAKLRQHTDPDRTVLMTDDSPIYDAVGQRYQDHHTVNHRANVYVRRATDGHLVTTNTAEGYFANLKRQISGTHHHTSKKHLPKYLEEHDYKYNIRGETDGARTEAAIKGIEGKRLTLYKSKSGGPSLFDHPPPLEGAALVADKAKRREERTRQRAEQGVRRSGQTKPTQAQEEG